MGRRGRIHRVASKLGRTGHQTKRNEKGSSPSCRCDVKSPQQRSCIIDALASPWQCAPPPWRSVSCPHVSLALPCPNQPPSSSHLFPSASSPRISIQILLGKAPGMRGRRRQNIPQSSSATQGGRKGDRHLQRRKQHGARSDRTNISCSLAARNMPLGRVVLGPGAPTTHVTPQVKS